MYQWSYDQFLPYEIYVHFQEDRRLWADRQQEEKDRLKQLQGK